MKPNAVCFAVNLPKDSGSVMRLLALALPLSLWKLSVMRFVLQGLDVWHWLCSTVAVLNWVGLQEFVLGAGLLSSRGS